MLRRSHEYSLPFCLALVALMVGVFLTTPSVTAQDAGDAEPAAEAPADEAPAADDAPAGEDNADAPAKKKEPMSLFAWTYKALTYYFWIFLMISIVFVALLVMNIMNARRENVVPLALVESFEACLEENQVQEAYDMAKEDESFLGKVLSAGLEKVSQGYDKAIEAMQEVGEEENMKLDHRLSYLALIGTLSPMIGLFGTVDGMIRAFSEIAISGSTPEASKLAEGISTALFTTLVGLALAIPAIAAYNILRNRVDRLALEVGITSEGLMSRFQNVGK